MFKVLKTIIAIFFSLIFLINSSDAKDYKYKKKLNLLFENKTKVYELKYSSTAWSRVAKTHTFTEVNEDNEVVSAFIGFHLPLETKPQWWMDEFKKRIILNDESPYSNKRNFNLNKNNSSRFLYVGEIDLRKIPKNNIFNLRTYINRLKKKYSVNLPYDLLTSTHINVNTKGIYFIIHSINHNLKNQKFISLNPSEIKTNPNLKPYMDDWIKLSLSRDQKITKLLNIANLETEINLENDTNYYFKKFKNNNLFKISNSQQDDKSIASENNEDQNQVASNEKDKELLAKKKADEEKKKKELLAKKRADEEKKKKELLAKKKADEAKPKNRLKKIIKSNFKDDDFIVLANLTPSAPHALFNLSGEITFDKKSVAYCFFNNTNLNKLEDVYFKRIFVDKYKIQFFYFQNNCDILKILENDIIITTAKNLISLKPENFSKFEALYNKKDLRLINFSRSENIQIFFELRKEKSKELKKSILNSEIEGFGSIVLKNESNELCLVTPKDEKKHLFLINKLNDEYALTGYDKEYDSIKFGSAEEIFIQIQRNNCGFLYTNQTNLKILINAMDKASIEHELISKWFFAKDVEQAELLEQDELIRNQNKLLDQQKKIAEEMEKKKNSGELLKEYTVNLRQKHENEVNGFKNYIQKEFEKFYIDKQSEENFFTNIYDEIKLFYNDLFSKGWESSEFSVKTIDFGTGVYKGRVISAHILNINTKMKNNLLGEYKNNCFQIGILDDNEFSFYRNGGLFDCEDNQNLRKWFLKNQFKTLWNPTLKDIAN